MWGQACLHWLQSNCTRTARPFYLYYQILYWCTYTMQACGVFQLPRVVCWWLCCSAYRRVLEKHEPARMSVLIKLLTSRMTAAANVMVNDQLSAWGMLLQYSGYCMLCCRESITHPPWLYNNNIICQGFIQWGDWGKLPPKLPSIPPKNLLELSIIIITISHQIRSKLLQIVSIDRNKFGMLNTSTHLSRFHPKFLSLDETLSVYINHHFLSLSLTHTHTHTAPSVGET